MFRERKVFWTALFIITIILLLAAIPAWFPRSRDVSERSVAISDLRLLGQTALFMSMEVSNDNDTIVLEDVLLQLGERRESRIRNQIEQGDLIFVKPFPPIGDRNIIAVLRFEEEILPLQKNSWVVSGSGRSPIL